MCGIVGIVGEEPIVLLLPDALKRLEHRGYYPAGTHVNERIDRRRAEGKLENLQGRRWQAST